ncbi:MAG TPA: TetR/AcrR family transcriptional regulator [Rhizomicrobium sp.]
MPTPSRQDRRKSRTRDALIGAAEALFAARGPDAVSVDEIVARADTAKGSFYNHFADKDALAREIARGVRGEIEREIDTVNAGIADPAARVARALCVFSKFARLHPDRIRAISHFHSGATDPAAPLNAGVRRDVTEGIESGRFSTTAPEAAILLVIGTVQASFHRALVTGEAAMRRTTPAMAALLLRGLGLKTAEAETVARDAADAVFGTKGKTP